MDPRRWLGRTVPLLARCLVSLLILGTALAVVSVLCYRIPYLGFATVVAGKLAVWFVVLPLVGAVMAWSIWRRRRSRYRTSLVVIGVLAAAGGAVITGRMIGAVQDAGADISVVRALVGVGTRSSVAPDAEPVYLRDQGDDLRVNVYRPAGSSRGSGDGAPVLLYVHGGGWSLGSRADRSTDMRWFADQGYLVLSIDYSLSNPDRHLWDVAQGQVGCAMSWVAENAARYGGDPAHLSLTGDSAGGNLAINAAYLQAAGELPSACGGTAPEVAAVAVTYPGVSLDMIYAYSSSGIRYVTDYIGGSPKQFPDRYAAVDSTRLITPNAPPTFILTGEADHLVPPNSIYAFAEQARTAGIETKLVRVPYADHIFDGGPGSIGQQSYRQLTAQWLGEHGQKPQFIR